ncbi:MAG: alpha/beta hydrolase [Ramlibacter sp.]|nr:alpha/beta hydrolase [Ramlibacter sp.]MBX3659359.1 alpha/beta hydrolase [Ramlibacter sp.]MCW5650717.1 alpha/beta hydrolase [Ramlibacter sp.]
MMMHSILRWVSGSVLVALLLVTGGCGGGGGAATDTTAGATGQVTSFTLKSAENGYVYTVQVFVPASYATGTATLPAIYATEGDAPYGGSQSRFEVFRSLMQRHGTQAILVGISGTERRTVDFLLPGAQAYVNFIARELAPAIERQYRADPARRALSGLSHGGYLVVAALVLEGTAGHLSFSHYLSTDSSFGAHPGVAAFLDFEKQLDTAGNPLPATLFLAGSTVANGPVVVAPLYAQMASHNHPGLTLLTAQYNTTHVGSDAPAFEEALTRFFP